MVNCQQQRRPEKKEGWGGVLLTALVCGAFLCWWFWPVEESGEAVREPQVWLALARQEYGEAVPGVEVCLQVVLVAEGLRQMGKEREAAELEKTWLPQTLQEPAREVSSLSSFRGKGDEQKDSPQEDVAFPGKGESAVAVVRPSPFLTQTEPSYLASIKAGLQEAQAALDVLEFDRALEKYRQTMEEVHRLPRGEREVAQWMVVAAMTRVGMAAEAAAWRRELAAEETVVVLPGWAISELLQADMVAATLPWWRARAVDDPEVVSMQRYFRELVRTQLQESEDTELARWGVRGDASRVAAAGTEPAEEALGQEDTRRLRQWAEHEDWEAVAQWVKQRPAGAPRAEAALEMARLLVWRRAPGQAL